MNTTIAGPADRLRSALKQAGFTARQATVRQRHSTLHVTIRDASVSLTRVAAIAGQFEVVRRDQATGEILCGGNTYVEVEYAAAIIAPVKASILAILDPAPDDEYVALPGGYRAIKVTRERGATYFGEVHIWGRGCDQRNQIAVGVAYAAERIAVASLDASAYGEGSAA
jgi:hypothetical protein